MSIKYGYSTGEVLQVFSENTYSGLLAANTEQTLAVPNIVPQCPSISATKKIIAVISVSGTAGLFVANNSTVIVPSTTISALAGELVSNAVPLTKVVEYGDTLHFISSTANTQFSVTFYVAF
jgi:hypothetical protein